MKILHLISSPRRVASFSIRLGNEIIERLQKRYPDAVVKTHDLTQTPFPHLEEVHLNSFMTDPLKRNEEFVDAAKPSDEAIAELMEADIIVIGVPMYNFSIHSTLKAWIDHVMRSGITFRYSAAGPEGLVKNKKVFLAVSTGGVYSEGPMKDFDFTEPYLVKALNFIGITDITTYRVEGTGIPELKDMAWSKAVELVEV